MNVKEYSLRGKKNFLICKLSRKHSKYVFYLVQYIMYEIHKTLNSNLKA